MFEIWHWVVSFGVDGGTHVIKSHKEKERTK
jgi:hypothetical protein